MINNIFKQLDDMILKELIGLNFNRDLTLSSVKKRFHRFVEILNWF